jgi:hypothetical protein
MVSIGYPFRLLHNTSKYLPFIKLVETRKSLKFFEVGHPIDGGIYCTSEMDSKDTFQFLHSLACIKETKLSFFMDMCSNLG